MVMELEWFLIAQVVCLKYIRDLPILSIKKKKIKCNIYNYVFTRNHMYPAMLYLKRIAKEKSGETASILHND